MKNMFQEKNSQRGMLVLMGIVLVLTSIILIAWFFLEGKNVVTGDFAEDKRFTSLTCTIKNLSYPYFTYDDTTEKETEVVAIFDKNNKISSISLTQKMYYSDDDMARSSEANNHASMNKSFGDVLGPDALNANYYANNGIMRMSLYASGKEYNANSRKYFLIDTASEMIDNIERSYAGKGFGCTKVIATN